MDYLVHFVSEKAKRRLVAYSYGLINFVHESTLQAWQLKYVNKLGPVAQATEIGNYGWSNISYLVLPEHIDYMLGAALRSNQTQFLLELGIVLKNQVLKSWLPTCNPITLFSIRPIVRFNSCLATYLIESDKNDDDVMIILTTFGINVSSQMLESSVLRESHLVLEYCLNQTNLDIIPALKRTIELGKRDKMRLLFDAVQQDKAHIKRASQDPTLDMSIEEKRNEITEWLCSRGLVKNMWSGIWTALVCDNEEALSILLKYIA